MLRLLEATEALAPLLVLALLYGIWFRRLPNRLTVLAICAAEAVIALVLVWQGTTEGLRPHEHYVPAQIHDGEVEAGHGG